MSGLSRNIVLSKETNVFNSFIAANKYRKISMRTFFDNFLKLIEGFSLFTFH